MIPLGSLPRWEEDLILMGYNEISRIREDRQKEHGRNKNTAIGRG